MTTRPFAADDFDAIRSRIAELKTETRIDAIAAHHNGGVFLRTTNEGIKEKLGKWRDVDGNISIVPCSKGQAEDWFRNHNYKIVWVPFETLD